MGVGCLLGCQWIAGRRGARSASPAAAVLVLPVDRVAILAGAGQVVRQIADLFLVLFVRRGVDLPGDLGQLPGPLLVVLVGDRRVGVPFSHLRSAFMISGSTSASASAACCGTCQPV